LQTPCKWKNWSASYSNNNDEENEKQKIKTYIRCVDLSLVCMLSEYVALWGLVREKYIVMIALFSCLSQKLTSLNFIIMLLISIIRHKNKNMLWKKGIIYSFVGLSAFNICPKNKWIQPARYIWHASTAGLLHTGSHILNKQLIK